MSDTNVGGGIGDLFNAGAAIWGGFEKKDNYDQEAKFYKKAAQWEKYSGQIKEVAYNRSVVQKLGQGRADIGASGIQLSGTAKDVMQSSAANAAVGRNMLGIQSKMDVDALLEQARQAKAEGSAAEIGGLLTGAGDIFSAAGSFGMI